MSLKCEQTHPSGVATAAAAATATTTAANIRACTYIYVHMHVYDDRSRGKMLSRRGGRGNAHTTTGRHIRPSYTLSAFCTHGGLGMLGQGDGVSRATSSVRDGQFVRAGRQEEVIHCYLS